MNEQQLKHILQEFTLWLEIGGFIQEDPNRTEHDWENQVAAFIQQRSEPSSIKPTDDAVCSRCGRYNCQHDEPQQPRCRFPSCHKPKQSTSDYCAHHDAYMILDWRTRPPIDK